jgi:hypothetical protein
MLTGPKSVLDETSWNVHAEIYFAKILGAVMVGSLIYVLKLECSKQFKWKLYFYVSGQSPPFAKTALKFKYEIQIG